MFVVNDWSENVVMIADTAALFSFTQPVQQQTMCAESGAESGAESCSESWCYTITLTILNNAYISNMLRDTNPNHIYSPMQ